MEILINLRQHDNARQLHAGDVIVAMPDGHAWTSLEIGRGDWAILRAPIFETHADMLSLALEEWRNGDPGPRLKLQRRYRLDIDRIPQLIAARRKNRLDRIIEVPRSLLENVTIDKVMSA